MDAQERQWRKDDEAQALHGDRCPHKAAIQYCPLYVASHIAGCAFACVDDLDRPCRVVRGEIDFTGTVAALRIANPMLVGQCEFGKMKADAKAQHNLNMRLNGIH